jgi:hypothetical protein
VSRQAAVLAAALAGVLAGCQDQRTDPTAPIAPRHAEAAGSARIRTEEAEFFQIASELPGFGGYFMDADGNLVVHLADLRQGGAAEARLAGRLREMQGRAPAEHRRAGRVVVRQGRHTFPELAAWREVLSDSVLGVLPGVVFTDANERHNRVVVGVRDEQTRGEVRSRLARFGIPGDAVVFEDAEASEEAMSTVEPVTYAGTLRSQTGAIMGGKRVSIYSAGGAYQGWCTVTFATRYGGSAAAVTNSHCSETRGLLEYSRYHFGGTHVGTEAKDPRFDNNCDWMVWQKCRNADALLFTIPSHPTQQGYIARPRLRHTGDSDDAVYGEIDPSNPTFTITGTGETRSGTYVNKVGAKTGWTYGVVEKTCVDTSTSVGHKFRCQHQAKYGRGGGDSGSPVFYWDGGSGAQFLGVHWGHVWNDFEYYAVYSSDNRIFLDLGTLTVTPPPPPPPYGVGISGNSYPPANSYQTYSASVTSGSAPFTYQWYIDGYPVSNDSYYEVYVDTSPFTLSVTVTDATGAQTGSSLWVEPYTGGAGCGTPGQIVCEM